MCERYSWIEHDGQVLFLTPNDILNTKRGKETQRYCGSKDDWVGHGAICFFYGLSRQSLRTGKEKECTRFTNPRRFPLELRKAIIEGQMWGFGLPIRKSEFLSPEGKAAWEYVEKLLRGYEDRATGIFKPGLLSYANQLSCSFKEDLLKREIELWGLIWADKKNRAKGWKTVPRTAKKSSRKGVQAKKKPKRHK